jgi:hypothetical protein
MRRSCARRYAPTGHPTTRGVVARERRSWHLPDMRAQLPGWMTAEFAVLRDGRTTAVVQNDFVDSFHRYRLIDCWRTPLLSLPESQRESAESAPRVGGGRGGIRVVPAGPFGEAVVRPYRRGGLVEKVNRRTYFVGSRAFSELVATHRLRRRGAPVPEVLAAVQSRFRAGYLACLVTRRIRSSGAQPRRAGRPFWSPWAARSVCCTKPAAFMPT